MDPKQLIHEKEARMELKLLGGVIKASVWLSPPDVSHTKSLHFLESRATLKFDPRQGSQLLRSQNWRHRFGQEYSLGVFQAGLNFPFVCPVNLEAPTHYEVVELAMRRGEQPIGKIQLNMPKEQAERTLVTLDCDRYWFAIPFSEGHGKVDKAVHLYQSGSFSESVSEVQFTNREYARRFSELNQLKRGKWQEVRHRLMVVAGIIGIIPFGGFGGAAGWVWLENTRSGNWGITDPVVTAIIALIGLAGFAACIYMLVKGSRGEPL